MENVNIIEKWIKSIIVGLNLCPYAKQPFESGKIKINICESEHIQLMFDSVIKEIEALNTNADFETTLVAFPIYENTFKEFYSFSMLIEEALEDANLLKDFQIVAFHPEFEFEGVDKSERINLVNRSPYPLIHILKSQSIANLNLTPSEGEDISRKNEEILNNMDNEKFDSLFKPLSK